MNKFGLLLDRADQCSLYEIFLYEGKSDQYRQHGEHDCRIFYLGSEGCHAICGTRVNTDITALCIQHDLIQDLLQGKFFCRRNV